MNLKLPLIIIKTLISVLLFLLAVSFEEASSDRLALYITFFTLFFLWGFVRAVFGSRAWFFFIDAGLIFLLEYQSKYVINYFLHSFYFLIILEAGFTLTKKEMTVVSVPIIILSSLKFIYYLFFRFTAESISEFLFNLVSLLFIITIVHYMLLQKEERDKKGLLYQELIQAYKQLRKYMKQSEQTAIFEERNRIARDIHDSVGHQLTNLIMQLEMIGIQLNKEDPSVIKKLLKKAQQTARYSLEETRKAINALQEDTGKFLTVKDVIEYFLENSDIEIKYFINNDEMLLQLTPEQSYVLYRVIQESLTNAIRHANAPILQISIERTENQLLFSLENNLPRTFSFKEGFGMKNMRERMNSVAGDIQFQMKDKTFCVTGRMPLNDENK